jgi:hypothetical protein
MYVQLLTLSLVLSSIVLVKFGFAKKEEASQLDATLMTATQTANDSKNFSDKMHAYFEKSTPMQPEKIEKRLFDIHTVFKENFKSYGITLAGGFNFGDGKNSSNQNSITLNDISKPVNKTNLKQVRLNLKGQYNSLLLFNRFWIDVMPKGVALENLTIKGQSFEVVLVVYGI